MMPGTRVRLRACPHGEPGIVRGIQRGRVLVEWQDLGIESRHLAERLELVGGVPKTSDSDRPDLPVNSIAESIVCSTQMHLTFGTQGERTK